MSSTSKAHPSTFTVGPEDRSVEFRIHSPQGVLGQPRVRPKRIPEGFAVEPIKGKRGAFRASWTGQLLEPETLVMGVESKVQMEPVKVRLIPALAAPEAPETPETAPEARPEARPEAPETPEEVAS